MPTEISISHFKAHCLEIIKGIQNKHESITITNRHKPVAKIQPVEGSEKISLFGLFKGKAEIKDDIISPISESWSAER